MYQKEIQPGRGRVRSPVTFQSSHLISEIKRSVQKYDNTKSNKHDQRECSLMACRIVWSGCAWDVLCVHLCFHLISNYFRLWLFWLFWRLSLHLFLPCLIRTEMVARSFFYLFCSSYLRGFWSFRKYFYQQLAFIKHRVCYLISSQVLKVHSIPQFSVSQEIGVIIHI